MPSTRGKASITPAIAVCSANRPPRVSPAGESAGPRWKSPPARARSEPERHAASVSLCPHRLRRRLPAADQAASGRGRAAELLSRQAANGGLRLLPHPLLALRGTTPARVHEPAFTVDDLAETLEGIHPAVRIVLPALAGALQQEALVLLEPLLQRAEHLVLGKELLPLLALGDHPPDEHQLLLGDVLGPHLDAERDALDLPLVELGAGGHALPVVHVDPQAGQRLHQRARLRQ